MPKVQNNQEKIEDLLTRGVDKLYPSSQFLRDLLASGRRLRLYFGIDPSGPTMHLGHSVILRKLSQFQALGHRVILLIGDFTALSGDPDKTEVRQRLTRAQVLRNCKKYKRQAAKFLAFSGANAAEYTFNSRWLAKLTFDRVIELASHITVQRLLDRDLFQRRISSGRPLYLHEFFYPLMQGYDSVNMDVDGEIGGSDQTFNMLTGRDLVKAYNGKEKFVLTTRLLEDPTGKKMGKTEGNMVTLADSPKDMFGKIMSWPDGMIVPGLELLTDMPMADINQQEKGMKDGSLNPRDVKAGLAGLLVAFYHGEAAATAAAQAFVQTFVRKEIPQDVPVKELPDLNRSLEEIMVALELCVSKSEARRLIQQGAVKIDSKKIIPGEKLKIARGSIVQVGPRKFVKIG